MYSKKGISVITLVVTIIVLLILAAISINFILGPKSLTTRGVEGRIDSRYGMIMDKIKTRETTLSVQEHSGEDGETAEEFVTKLIADGIFNTSQDAYESDYSRIYIGQMDDGAFEFNGKKYKYVIEVIEPDSVHLGDGDISFVFNLDGGKISDSTEQIRLKGKKDNSVIVPFNPTKNGYTFAGWSPSVPSKFDKDTTFIAKWTSDGIVMSFNLNGGNIEGDTSVQIRTGNAGDPLSKPLNPEKEHYVFNGWKSESGDEEVPSTFDESKKFIAQWKPAKYDITYNLNGGRFNNSAVNPRRNVEYNTLPPILEPIMKNKMFIGWTPEPSLTIKNQTYTAMWATPMEIKMIKANVNEEILIPITIPANGFVLISNNDGEYVKYTNNNLYITNNVLANKAFNIKIVGRIKQFAYPKVADSYRKQMYKLINWGELGAETYKFSGDRLNTSVPKGGCDNLTGPLPVPEKNSFTNIKNFDYTFYNCGKIGQIPPKLFKNAFKATTYRGTFGGNVNYYNTIKTTIPADLFKDSPDVTSFQDLFYSCRNLTGTIPPDLFEVHTKVTSFQGIFFYCGNLTGTIPPDLFKSSSEVKSFSQAFFKCGGLTGNIPETLFANAIKAESFIATFHTCNGLTGSIPANLFASCIEARTFNVVFNGCTGLTGEIPETLFANCTKATSFGGSIPGLVSGDGLGAFDYCRNLTGSIPANLFANCPNVTSFQRTFAYCNNLSGSIPANLFANNLNVTNFNNTFTYCSNLTSIPTNLFANNFKVTSFNATFAYCNGLTVIPENLFANCPKVTNFNSTFASCKNLTGIPEKLFTNCPEVISFNSTFRGCLGLTESIPEDLFKYNTKVTSFGSTFEGELNNISLLASEIPENLFKYNPEVTTFGGTFRYRGNLTGNIPENLFKYNTKVTSFVGTFGGSPTNRSKLSGPIPENLFRYSPEVTSFASTFSYCENLTGVIPENLFKYNPEVTSFTGTFAYCKSLTGISEHLFKYNTKVTMFGNYLPSDTDGSASYSEGTFAFCSGLTGPIPENLFAYNIEATSFAKVFEGCSSLTGAIPEKLFLYNTKAENFARTFENCKNLTSIPKDLFKNNPDANRFYATFRGCTGLTTGIPENLFTNNPEVMDFRHVFSGCTGLSNNMPTNLFANNAKVNFFRQAFYNCSNITGNAPNLWDRTNVSDSRECFKGCTKLSNYSAIPTTWK